MQPSIDTDAGPFQLVTRPGHERKTTSSYYTHSQLIKCVLDSRPGPTRRRGPEQARPGEGSPEPKNLRPSLRQRTLPDRGRRPPRQARGPATHRRRRAEPDRDPACQTRRDRPVCPRGRLEPHGGRALQGQPLDGGPRAGQAAGLPRPADPGREQPDGGDACLAGQGNPRRCVRADRGGRPLGVHRIQATQQGRAARPGNDVRPLRGVGLSR